MAKPARKNRNGRPAPAKPSRTARPAPQTSARPGGEAAVPAAAALPETPAPTERTAVPVSSARPGRPPYPFPATGDRTRLVWGTAGALTVLGLAAFAVDVPLAHWLKRTGFPTGEIGNLVDVCESFGNGWGVILILIAVRLLDPFGRRIVPRLALASLGGGMAANLFKVVIARNRPNAMRLYPDGVPVEVWATFRDWFPSWFLEGKYQSFPSAHAAAGMGLAVALSAAYPRGTRLFYALAAMVAYQRMHASMHYGSDVFIGAAIGWLWAQSLMHGRLGRCCDGWEAYFRRRRRPETPPAAAPV